ncbi:MAG TPA: sensor histidine kinase [Candidatus Binatia bacterium]|nr:sensor histidine kinase [Candidatus Binatia bacterium]
MTLVESSQLRKERALAWLRAGFSLLTVILWELHPAGQVQSSLLTYVPPYGFLIYSSIVLYYLYFTTSPKLENLGLISSLLDLFWVALLVLSRQEPNRFLFLYMFPIITASVHYALKGSLLVALIGVGLSQLARMSMFDPSDANTFFAVQGTGLLAFATILGVLNDLEKRQNKKLTSLSETAAQVAIQEERKRVSRELHDRVLQLLASVRLRTELCRTELTGKPQELARELEAIGGAADSALTEIRNVMAEKQAPTDLVAGTLERRLREELEIFRARTGLKLKFQCTIKAESLPYEVERELYFALREGIINSVRHSRASELNLSLSQNEATYNVNLSDNGVGFDPASIESSTHYGLRSMKQRIEKFGGQVSIDTAPEKGTWISMTVPIQQKPA